MLLCSYVIILSNIVIILIITYGYSVVRYYSISASRNRNHVCINIYVKYILYIISVGYSIHWLSITNMSIVVIVGIIVNIAINSSIRLYSS